MVTQSLRKNNMYTQINNPCPITSCGRRRIERIKSIYKKPKSRKAGKLNIKK